MMYNDSGMRLLAGYFAVAALSYALFLYMLSPLAGTIAALVIAGLLGYVWSHLKRADKKRKKHGHQDDKS
jgi:high-affinity Fe2+/Pb2+ permease